jgi:hypothetical protein
MKETNLSDRIEEVRIADNYSYYTSYLPKDLIIDGNSIKLKHLLETEIDDLYIDELQESISSLSVSAILNIEIIVTDQETNESAISSFIEEVDVVRLDVDSCSDQDLLDLHRSVVFDEVESEIENRFNASTLDARVIAKEDL